MKVKSLKAAEVLIEAKYYSPFDLHIDSEATHLFPRWWHKFIFWKKYKYPKFNIKAQRISLDKLIKK